MDAAAAASTEPRARRGGGALAGNASRERGLLFSAPMVRALLAGTKTQTRRIMKPSTVAFLGSKAGQMDSADEHCPYGVVGDRLWVRETWYCDHCFAGDFETTRSTTYVGRVLTNEECIAEWRGLPISGDLTPAGHMMYYRADGEADTQFEQLETPFRWRPGIHMFRWASRITLEVTDVRVERLQEISEKDAIAEGLSRDDGRWLGSGEFPVRYIDPVEAYGDLWRSINGPASWAANPWVWALTFRRVQS